MRRLTVILLVLCCLSFATVHAGGSVPQWEVIAEREIPVEDRAQASVRSEAVEVEVHQGKVYITLESPEKVEIFTILGQLVTSRKVSAGCVRLTLPQRGVYILKAGGVTRRINI